MENFQTWEELKKELNITPEQQKEIDLEVELMQATTEARKSKNITQEELSRKSGLKQSVIARIEKGTHSPTINTLMRYLLPIGYTLKIVPTNTLKDNNKKDKN